MHGVTGRNRPAGAPDCSLPASYPSVLRAGIAGASDFSAEAEEPSVGVLGPDVRSGASVSGAGVPVAQLFFELFLFRQPQVFLVFPPELGDLLVRLGSELPRCFEKLEVAQSAAPVFQALGVLNCPAVDASVER